MPSLPLRRYGICLECTEVLAEGATCACQGGAVVPELPPRRERVSQPVPGARLRAWKPALFGLGAGVAAVVFLLSAA